MEKTENKPKMIFEKAPEEKKKGNGLGGFFKGLGLGAVGGWFGKVVVDKFIFKK